MKRSVIFSLFLSVITRVVGLAQPVLPPLNDISELRPTGERRLWTFVTKDSALGQLHSIVGEKTEIDGEKGLTINSQLSIDLNKIGFLQNSDIIESWTVSLSGDFLASDIKADISGQKVDIQLVRDGDSLKGSVSRDDQKREQTAAYPSGRFAVNSFFVDQLELFFASREMRVGNKFDEEIFVPMDMLPSRIVGEITEFSWQRLHSGFIDSVFVVQLSQPGKMELFFTRDRNLRKVNYPNQKIRAYLDLIQKAQSASATTERISPGNAQKMIGRLIPFWFLYLLFGVVSTLFFIGRAYKKSLTYVALFAGAILFGIMTLTIYPLQEKLINILLVPAVQKGESLYLIALLPALLVGLGQALFVAFGIDGFSKWKNIKSFAPTVGAVLGAGLGIAEAVFISLKIPVSGQTFWTLFERGFFILFHTLSSGIIAWALTRNIKIVVWTAAGVGLVNSLFRYMPILVQNRLVTEEATRLVIASVTVLLLLAVLLLLKQKQNEKSL